MAAAPPCMAAPHLAHWRAGDRALAGRWPEISGRSMRNWLRTSSGTCEEAARGDALVAHRIARLRRASHGRARPCAARDLVASAAAMRRRLRQRCDG
ncbi:hypothetical protein F511_45386 [Dorcoceras hygrometricum]|uniref:Uncharacterized protein n=1 Tax=Dorcoceras hygrometricum TaxID=472368 RepID=A0A2Z7A3U9_9LAMI|nr:hypothetical protein F511_45386 [Dorcoceras hygrometricum]